MSFDPEEQEERKAMILGSEKKKLDPPNMVSSRVGQILMLGAMMGGPGLRQIAKGLEKAEPPKVRAEDDPRFHRPEKISPAEFFISTGPGEIEGQHYAVVMAPSEEDPSGYSIIAKSRYGFDSPEAAKTDAAKQFPSLPVLSGPDQYHYPFYDMQKMRVLVMAQEKRQRRADKAQRNAERSKAGHYQTKTKHTGENK